MASLRLLPHTRMGQLAILLLVIAGLAQFWAGGKQSYGAVVMIYLLVYPAVPIAWLMGVAAVIWHKERSILILAFILLSLAWLIVSLPKLYIGEMQ